MRIPNRFGLAAGLAAALAFYGTARAQTPGGSAGTGTSQEAQPSQPSTGSTGGMQQGETQGEQQQTMKGETAAQPKIKETLANDLEKLHAVNQAEIQMGQMGEQQAQAPEVKDYARKLVDDHKQLDSKLTSQASELGVNLEGKAFDKAQKDTQKSMKKLEGKSGTAFDKEFMSMAVKDHKKDQKDAQKAAKEARKEKQEQVAMLFDEASTGIKGHLSEAQRLKTQVDKGAKRQGRRGTTEPKSETGGTQPTQ